MSWLKTGIKYFFYNIFSVLIQNIQCIYFLTSWFIHFLTWIFENRICFLLSKWQLAVWETSANKKRVSNCNAPSWRFYRRNFNSHRVGNSEVKNSHTVSYEKLFCVFIPYWVIRLLFLRKTVIASRFIGYEWWQLIRACIFPFFTNRASKCKTGCKNVSAYHLFNRKLLAIVQKIFFWGLDSSNSGRHIYSKSRPFSTVKLFVINILYWLHFEI